MAKLDRSINFKTDDAMADWIGKTTVKLDCSLSELVRACLILGIPILKSYPAMVKTLPLNERDAQ